MPASPRPAPADPSEQSARPGMVHWYQPWLLIQIGMRALVATVIGQIADNRELQAVDYRNQDNLWDYSGPDELWFDFVADIGDGWEASHAVACALARDTLDIEGCVLPRSKLLIIGGDLVYPDPSHTGYQNRALAPYQAACETAGGFDADVFALPGNHDWYDGLHAFQDIFCHDPAESPEWPLGCWNKRQTHSYFALQLPHHWWVLAPDVQLDNRINPAQRAYFRRIAQQMTAASRVVLIAPFPNWAQIDPNANDGVLRWMQRLCAQAGAEVKLVLTGDLHHYARFEQDTHNTATTNTPLQLITAGGGGAFLHPTHTLPDRVALQALEEVTPGTGQTPSSPEAGTVAEIVRRSEWPAQPASRRMTLGNAMFPVTNMQISLFVGFIYTMLAWVLETRLLVGDANLSMLFHNMLESHQGIGGTLTRMLAMLPKSPEFALVIVLTALGLTAFNENCRAGTRILLGAFHTLLHVVGLIITYCMAIEITSWLDGHLNALSFSFFWFLLCMVVIGGGVGGVVIGLYLAVSLNLFGANITNAFSSLRLASHRNFLRLHIATNGELTVHALGIEQPQGEHSSVRSIDDKVVIR